MRRLGIVWLLVALVGAGCSDKKSDDETTPTTGDSSLKVFTGPPPWPVADRQGERIVEAGLPTLRIEGERIHFHAHLDVFHNGDPVVVPEGVGIDQVRRLISPFHTHFDTGVLHVEADDDDPSTIGQFLQQWGLRVDGDCIADICAPQPIELYVNGVKQSGLVTEHVVEADQQIALILGSPPAKIPKGYACVHPEDACPNTPAP